MKWGSMMDISKYRNEIYTIDNIRIGYQGVRGSFSEEAMIRYFGERDNFCNFEEFEDVFISLQNNEIDYGVLPIENSYTGSITEVYDLLVKYGFYIIVFIVDVRFNHIKIVNFCSS